MVNEIFNRPQAVAEQVVKEHGRVRASWKCTQWRGKKNNNNEVFTRGMAPVIKVLKACCDFSNFLYGLCNRLLCKRNKYVMNKEKKQQYWQWLGWSNNLPFQKCCFRCNCWG